MAAGQPRGPESGRAALNWLARVLLRSFIVPVLVILVVLSIAGALMR